MTLAMTSVMAWAMAAGGVVVASAAQAQSIVPGVPLRANSPETTAATPAASASAPHAGRIDRTVRVTETQGAVRATVPGDSLWEIAGAATGAGVDRNQAMVAIMRRNPEAFPEGNLYRIEKGLSLVIPPLSEVRREDRAKAAVLVAQHGVAYLNRSVVPMAIYALAGAAPASTAPASAVATAAPAAPGPAALPAMPASQEPSAPPASPASPASPTTPTTPTTPTSSASSDAPAALGSVDASVHAPVDAPVAAASDTAPAASSPTASRPDASVPWVPVLLLLVCGAGAAVLLWRRRGVAGGASHLDPDERAHASQLFADSRLALESQLLEQPEIDSEPLYSTLDEPVDALPAPQAAGAAPPSAVLVLRNGEGSAATAGQELAAASQDASGGALALALTVAHAYADVGRPEAARRWLRAIDARGAGAFAQDD